MTLRDPVTGRFVRAEDKPQTFGDRWLDLPPLTPPIRDAEWSDADKWAPIDPVPVRVGWRDALIGAAAVALVIWVFAVLGWAAWRAM